MCSPQVFHDFNTNVYAGSEVKGSYAFSMEYIVRSYLILKVPSEFFITKG